MVQTVVAVQDVRKSFSEGRTPVEVLRGISLTIEAGEILAIEGPSGSGKTTLLSILGAILTPTSGSVSIYGQSITDLSEGSALAAIRKKYIGFIFQQFNLFPALTAAENVAYALEIRGFSSPAAEEAARTTLERVGLSERVDFLPRDLSGGQKQRVAIARALASNPPLLLADEPTANLDSTVGRETLSLLRQLAKEQGAAVVIVTHDPTVRTITDRVVTIRDGRLQE